MAASPSWDATWTAPCCATYFVRPWEEKLRATRRLLETVRDVWLTTARPEPPRVDYVRQIRDRLPELYAMHPQLETVRRRQTRVFGIRHPSLEELLEEAHPRLAALLDPDETAKLGALSRAELWQLERKSDVDVDAIYGPGTFDLAGRTEVLVLLKWRHDVQGIPVRRLGVAEALANLPLFQKDLGVFDLRRPPGRLDAGAGLARHAAVLDRVTTLEVTGGVDFSALVDLVGDFVAK